MVEQTMKHVHPTSKHESDCQLFNHQQQLMFWPTNMGMQLKKIADERWQLSEKLVDQLLGIWLIRLL